MHIYTVLYKSYTDVLQLVLSKGKLRIDDGDKIQMKDLKDTFPDEIIDHCAGLLLIKPICVIDTWQHLENHGNITTYIIAN